jgi:hypothetical protein
MKEETHWLRRVLIDRLGPGGHTTLETGFDEAVVLIADEVARGCMIYCRDTHQRIEREEDFRSLVESGEEPVRIMVIPPVAGG